MLADQDLRLRPSRAFGPVEQETVHLAMKAGSISSKQPWSRSRRKTRISRSSLRWSLEKRGIGVQPCQGLKRFDWFSTAAEVETTYHSFLKKTKQPAHKSSSCEWSSDGGSSFREIVRQQWNFSPPETKREVEEYQVELSNVTVLELIVVPNMSGGTARASLKSLRLY